MNLPPIYLLRHGETEWNRDDRRQGRKGSLLTERGTDQAHAMGHTLAKELMRGVRWQMQSSPQERAQQTAEIVGRSCGLPFTLDDRLMEIGMGSWEGLTWPEIDARWPGASDDKRTAHFRIPDGEPYDAVAARARSWLDSLTGPTIAVSHGVFGRVLRIVYLGLDEEAFASVEGGEQDSFYLLVDGEIRTISCAPVLGIDPQV